MVDVIIIGGGSAGLMAAVAAGEAGAKVLVVEKGDSLGRKLGITGGGRCNVTNAKDTEELIAFIPGNGRFLRSSLATFGTADIITFFENMGIRLKEEDNGRMFPVSDKAKTVVDALINKVRSLGVEIRLNSPVKEVLYEDGVVIGVQLKNKEKLHAAAIIVAVGGKSVPQTGSEGDGYVWAEKAGHTVTELYPTEVPLTSTEDFIRSKNLQGLSLRNVELTVWNDKNKKIVTHQGDLLFTHFGLSGPVALRCSQFVVKELKRTKGISTVRLTLDMFPMKTIEEVFEESRNFVKEDSQKAIRNALKGWLPERLLPLLLSIAGIDDDTTFHHLPKQGWLKLAQISKAFPIQVNGTLSIEQAFVTGGGVHLKEIDPKTMESKIVPGLYFCGEVMDIHGYTGGYNITAAFTTGYTAGVHAATSK